MTTITEQTTSKKSIGDEEINIDYSRFVSPAHDIGLGRSAVEKSIAHYDSVLKDKERGRDPDRDESIDELSEGSVRLDMILNVRKKLAELSPKQRRWFNAQIRREQMSPWLFYAIDPEEYKRAKGGKPKKGELSKDYDFVARLTAEYSPEELERRRQQWAETPLDDMDMKEDTADRLWDEHIVPDRTLLNFLQWHNYMLARKTKELNEQKEQLIADFTDKVERAIADGHLPKEALTYIENLRSAYILVDDGFTTEFYGTYFKDDIQKVGGYFGLGRAGGSKDVIVIHPMYIAEGYSEKDLEKLFSHEAFHCLSRGGFMGKQGGSIVLNEAMTEHNAQCILAGEWETIDPDERGPSGYYSSYEEYRKVLDMLCNGGARPVPLELFQNLYGFRGLDEKDYKEAEEKLRKALKKAYPTFDALSAVVSVQNSEEAEDLLVILRYESEKARAKEWRRTKRRIGAAMLAVITTIATGLHVIDSNSGNDHSPSTIEVTSNYESEITEGLRMPEEVEPIQGTEPSTKVEMIGPESVSNNVEVPMVGPGTVADITTDPGDTSHRSTREDNLSYAKPNGGR